MAWVSFGHLACRAASGPAYASPSPCAPPLSDAPYITVLQGGDIQLHTRIGNIRKDFLHQATHAISQNHAIVCLEELKVRAMSKSAAGDAKQPGRNVRAKSGLNKAILDQGCLAARRGRSPRPFRPQDRLAKREGGEGLNQDSRGQQQESSQATPPASGERGCQIWNTSQDHAKIRAYLTLAATPPDRPQACQRQGHGAKLERHVQPARHVDREWRFTAAPPRLPHQAAQTPGKNLPSPAC